LQESGKVFDEVHLLESMASGGAMLVLMQVRPFAGIPCFPVGFLLFRVFTSFSISLLSILLKEKFSVISSSFIYFTERCPL
jgi:hypothetical protein